MRTLRVVQRRVAHACMCFALSFAELSLLLSVPAAAQGGGNFPKISLTQFATGFELQTYITNAGDQSGRLFVVEQKGRVKILKNATVRGTLFLDITDRVLSGGERGLLSIAFPPGYSGKQYFYADYTDLSGNLVISRFHVTANPDIADPASEEQILMIPHPTFGNHNGGQLVFGPNDGFLYVGTGDGGGAGDPFNNSQNVNVLLGKILRIDVESGQVPYAIPSSNPFVGITGMRGEIWAYGLRNPWRFSFDRATADLYIGDVGQDHFEEIDFQSASAGGGGELWVEHP